jgi:hypothetical protein
METYTSTPRCCGHHGDWWGPPPYGWFGRMPYPFMPFPYMPMGRHHDTMSFLETVDPGTSPREIIVGGSSPTPVTLEYMPTDGATTPTITLKTTGSGATITWADNAVTAGYHLLKDVCTVQPGTKITIEVKEVVARIRWRETIP